MPLDMSMPGACEKCNDAPTTKPCLEHALPPVVCGDCGIETQPEEWTWVDATNKPFWHHGCGGTPYLKTCPHCGGVL